MLMDQRRCPGKRCTWTAGRGTRWPTRSAPWPSAARRRSASRRRRRGARGARRRGARRRGALRRRLERLCARPRRGTRPTAVNLFWALERMRARFARAGGPAPAELRARARSAEAHASTTRTWRLNRRLGRHGAELIPEGAARPHPLQRGRRSPPPATARRWASIRAAREAGKQRSRVRRRDAPRPAGRAAHRLGARRARASPTTLITDIMAGHFMARGRGGPASSSAPTGSPPTATSPTRSGRTASRSWRTSTAIPFYVAAPFSTIDLAIPTATSIPIEERAPARCTQLAGRRIAPSGVARRATRPSTSPRRALITAIVTERGIYRGPYHFGGETAGARS